MRRTIGILLGVVALVIAVPAVQWLTGWKPRFGLEAEFQRVINGVDIVDHYRGSEGGGWDQADVTTVICGKVARATLTSLGIPVDDRRSWSFKVNGSTEKPEDIWRIYQDKGAIASCRDNSIRYLAIGIDRITSVCRAKVSVLPSCDL